MPKPETSRITKWLPLNDFTAGCYNYSNISSAAPIAPYPNPGAADARFTRGCMALNQGGLGPLPKMVKSNVYPVSNPTFTTKVYIVGLASLPLTGHLDGVISMAESWKAPSKKLYQVIEILTTSTAHTTLITHVYTTTQNSFFGSPFPALTRIAASTPSTTAGHHTLVWPSNISTFGTGTGQLWQYPNITTDTSTAPKNFLGANVTGQVVIHNGRVAVLAGLGYDMGITQISVNENINYTTPSNSQTFHTQRLVLSPQFPYGYGCAGSISAGELFLVKKRGGGIILSGTFNSGSVTNLPGVQSTGDFYGNCAQTAAGLFYCSTSQGAWVWNGGNLALKISQNLDDDFFVCSNVVPNCNNLGFNAYPWGEWVLFSNSWIYNLRQQSWWKLQIDTLFHYQPGKTGRYMYAAPQVVANSAADYLYRFDKQTPVTTWTWQSLPNRLEQNRFLNVRTIVLYVSNQSNATSTIKVTINNGTSPAFSFTTTTTKAPIGPEPRLIRIAAGGINLFNAIIKITAKGHGAAAPILHAITLGCTTAQHAGPTL